MIIKLDGGFFADVLTPVILLYDSIVERDGFIRCYRGEDERPMAVILANNPEQVRLEAAAGHNVIWACTQAKLDELKVEEEGSLLRIHLGAEFEFEEVGICIWKCTPEAAHGIITEAFGL